MQSWSCDLSSPGGDLNVSQAMNTWSKCLGRGGKVSKRVNVSGSVHRVPLSVRMPSTQQTCTFPSILFPSDSSQVVVYG